MIRNACRFETPGPPCPPGYELQALNQDHSETAPTARLKRLGVRETDGADGTGDRTNWRSPQSSKARTRRPVRGATRDGCTEQRRPSLSGSPKGSEASTPGTSKVDVSVPGSPGIQNRNVASFCQDASIAAVDLGDVSAGAGDDEPGHAASFDHGFDPGSVGARLVLRRG